MYQIPEENIDQMAKGLEAGTRIPRSVVIQLAPCRSPKLVTLQAFVRLLNKVGPDTADELKAAVLILLPESD